MFKHTKDTGERGERMEGGGRNKDGWRKRERRRGGGREGEGEEGREGRKWGELFLLRTLIQPFRCRARTNHAASLMQSGCATQFKFRNLVYFSKDPVILGKIQGPG